MSKKENFENTRQKKLIFKIWIRMIVSYLDPQPSTKLKVTREYI
jgi:hypothetical protein